jgi:RNA polymerase sigma-70 factor (ECF subfamily)
MNAKELFDEYHLPVFRYLRRMTGDQGLAEDLTQDVFLRVVRSLPSDLTDSHKGPWIFTLARNVMRNSHRDRSRRPTVALEGKPEPAICGSQAQGIELDRAVGRLEATDREVFLLRELGGFGYAEISDVCGITQDAVRSRLYRARVALREALVGIERRA